MTKFAPEKHTVSYLDKLKFLLSNPRLKGKIVKIDKDLLMKNSLLLLFLSLILVSTTAILFSRVVFVREILPNVLSTSLNDKEQITAKTYPSIPILISREYPSFPLMSAQAILAIDLDSMMPLYEKNPNLTLLPASTTKIITALVAFEKYNPGDILVVRNLHSSGQKMNLVEGEYITAGNLYKGLLIHSANDAAETLAENYPGGADNFVLEMNKKASGLNMHNSHFENPTGFDSERHFSTASDLIKASVVAMQNAEFVRLVGTRQDLITSIDGNIQHELKNTNLLLGEVDGVSGIKTGWTENARENLITFIEKDNHRVIIALLGSQDRFGETKELINWIYANYRWQEVKYPG